MTETIDSVDTYLTPEQQQRAVCLTVARAALITSAGFAKSSLDVGPNSAGLIDLAEFVYSGDLIVRLDGDDKMTITKIDRETRQFESAHVPAPEEEVGNITINVNAAALSDQERKNLQTLQDLTRKARRASREQARKA